MEGVQLLSPKIVALIERVREQLSHSDELVQQSVVIVNRTRELVDKHRTDADPAP